MQSTGIARAQTSVLLPLRDGTRSKSGQAGGRGWDTVGRVAVMAPGRHGVAGNRVRSQVPRLEFQLQLLGGATWQVPRTLPWGSEL